jgi:hypothetical protein
MSAFDSNSGESDSVTALVLSLMDQLRAAQELAQLREELIKVLQDKLGHQSSSTCDQEEEEPRLNLLEALRISDAQDEAKVVTVRKVHKLGFRSAHFLRVHFQQFGPVEDVVLLPMRARPKPGPDGSLRSARPSSMGFVVFASRPAALAALSHGATHDIRGWPVEVRAFVRPKDRPTD